MKDRITEVKNVIGEKYRANRLILAAFLLPAGIMIITLAAVGVYPFGENQIPVIDMYHQYVPFLGELQYKLQEGGSLFYSWNGAGGFNFLTLIAYYGASPLNLLLILFPKKLIVEGVTVILIIKIGLAGGFMAVYLRYKEKACSMVTVAFSTLYALSSYVMAYYWCIMWMDAVMLLPLCIMGLNKIIDGEKPVLYTVTLAVIIFSNYYMAIMVCIFILFYYPVLYFIKCKGAGVRSCLVTTGKAVGFSFLGIGLSAVMLLPTYAGMQDTYYISAKMPDNWLFYNDALDILNQLLPNAELTYRDGLPNLYCGLIVVILLVFYIVSKTVPLREKALNLGFLTFMFLSLNINKLDFMWHGFHFPNQLPYRYTFVICFILIGMAYKAFLKIEEVRTNLIWQVLGASILYLLFAQKLMKEVDDKQMFFYMGVIWALLYCTVMVLYKKKVIRKASFSLLIVVLIGAEMLSGACTSIEKIGTTNRDAYFANREDILKLTESVEDEFARTEINDNYILNCPAFYHYKGISQFSSSINAGTTALMEDIGIEGEPAKNRFNYNQTNPVTNAILNVKYLIGKNIAIDDEDFKLISKSGHSRLYENTMTLSIGYMTADQIRTWNYECENPFDALDDYVRAATGNVCGKVFRDIGEAQVKAANVEIEKTGIGIVSCAVKSTSKKSRVILTYTASETAKHYLFVETTGASDITVTNGRTEEDIGIRNDCGSVVNIGEIKAGDTFDVVIEYNAGKIGDIRSHVCTLDRDEWNKAYGILSRDMMKVTDFDDTHVKGTIEVTEPGVFVTSIPYDRGWKLEVDGTERNIDELVGGAFIATPLEEGKHEISLTFRPPGLAAGAAVTALSALILALFMWLRRKKETGEGLSFSRKPQETREPLKSPQEESDCNIE